MAREIGKRELELRALTERRAAEREAANRPPKRQTIEKLAKAIDQIPAKKPRKAKAAKKAKRRPAEKVPF